MKQLFSLLCTALLLATSCSRDGYDYVGGDLPLSKDAGEVSVRLLAEQVIYPALQGTRGEDNLPSVEDFTIELLNSSDQVIRRWAGASEMPASFRVNAGNYTLQARYGNPYAVGADAIYFAGVLPFTVAPQQVQSLKLICKQANVKFAAEFGTNIQASYTDYQVQLKALDVEGTPSVTFTKDDAGLQLYMPTGRIQPIITMSREGFSRTYKAETFTANPQEFITLKIDGDDERGDFDITITTNSELNEVPTSVKLPLFTLPKDPPTAAMDGYTGDELTFVEGDLPAPVVLRFSASGLIKSCVVSVNSAELTAAGWPASFDLCNMSDEVASAVSASGLVILPAAGVKGQKLANLDFTNLLGKLTTPDGVTSESSFTVECTDSFDQTVTQELTFKVAPPVFALSAPSAAAVWATKVDMSGTMSAGDEAKLVAEYSTDNTTWKTTRQSAPSLNAGALSMSAYDLPAATALSVRLRYGAHLSSAYSLTTETAAQVPNNNFETYSEYKNKSDNKKNQYYWNSGSSDTNKWWATRNAATGGQTTDYFGAGLNGYCCMNGSSPVDNAPNGKAVEMRTTAWGAGTTMSGGSSTIYNVTAGILFIGDYTCDVKVVKVVLVPTDRMQSETIKQGRPFGSRPAKFQFQYKYTRYGEDSFDAHAVVLGAGGVEIGRATATGTNVKQASMKNVSFDFVYNENAKTMKAAEIRVFFSSSVTQWPTEPPFEKGSNPHTGSVLTVDKLNFDYNF